MVNVAGLDLNLLRAFDFLMQERHVTRAAQRLGLTQPAMSNALGRLRRLLDDPVLVRTSAGMTPTPLALELERPIREALGQLEAALQRRHDFEPSRTEATLRLAVTDHSAFVLLPRLAALLAREAPGLNLVSQPWRGAPTYRETEAGSIDFALGVGELDDLPAGLFRHTLFGDRFVTAVRADHPSVGERLDLDQFVALTHVLVSPRGHRTGLVDDALRERGRARRVVVAVPHFLAAPAIVAATDHVITMSAYVARPFAAIWSLRLLEPPLPLATGEWFCLWHERIHRSPLHRWFRERLFAVAREVEREAAAA